MTREQLVYATMGYKGAFTCPRNSCASGRCFDCAEKQLAEYEARVKTETIEEFIKYFDEESDFDIIHNDEYGEYEPSRYSLKDIFDNFLESQRTANLTIDKAEVIKEQK